MHTDNVGIGPELNDVLWERGIRNPPHKVTVQVKSIDTGAYVNLVGKSLEPAKVEQKVTSEQKNMLEEQLTKLTGKNGEKSSAPDDTSKKSEAPEEK
jgi:ribosomal protein L31E